MHVSAVVTTTSTRTWSRQWRWTWIIRSTAISKLPRPKLSSCIPDCSRASPRHIDATSIPAANAAFHLRAPAIDHVLRHRKQTNIPPHPQLIEDRALHARVSSVQQRQEQQHRVELDRDVSVAHQPQRRRGASQRVEPVLDPGQQLTARLLHRLIPQEPLPVQLALLDRSVRVAGLVRVDGRPQHAQDVDEKRGADAVARTGDGQDRKNKVVPARVLRGGSPQIQPVDAAVDRDLSAARHEHRELEHALADHARRVADPDVLRYGLIQRLVRLPEHQPTLELPVRLCLHALHLSRAQPVSLRPVLAHPPFLRHRFEQVHARLDTVDLH
eukprot:1519454-Rhodomonas_salina.1